MSTVNLSTIDKGKSTITVLEELHRPLEEHWAVTTKFGLDPKQSDYIYKHHLSHLEDIYQNRKFEVKEPARSLVQNPAAQLYGVHGMKSNRPIQKQVEKARETKWVPNFQKYHYLDDRLNQQKKQESRGNTENTRSRSPSSGTFIRKRTEERRFGEGEEDADNYFGTSSSGQPSIHFSRKATNQDLSDTDVIMFGMYRLNPKQEEIYRNFVEMLGEFNQFDKESIIEDVLNEATHTTVTLDDYGGTSLEDE